MNRSDPNISPPRSPNFKTSYEEENLDEEEENPEKERQTESDMLLVEDGALINNIIEDLQKLNIFTVNDSRIYTTLLMIGVSSPARIAEKSQVDRARVYDSLKRLVKRGFVEEEPVQRAPKYHAVSPEKVFASIRNKFETKIKLAEKLESQLQQVHNNRPAEPNSIWYIQGEQKINTQINHIISNAEKYCLLLLTNDKNPDSLRQLEQLTKILVEKKKSIPELEIRIVIKVEPDWKEQRNLLNQLYHAEIDIFRWNPGGIIPLGLYITEKSYLQTILSDVDPRPGFNYGFFMENPSEQQSSGLLHLFMWLYAHLCQKVVFQKK